MIESIRGVTDQESARAIQLSGPWFGEENGWSEDRVRRWVHVFLTLGVVLRLLRFGLRYPLWRDEAYVVANLFDRDFLGLTRPLDYQQVCPILFLWAEKAIAQLLGFNEWTLRLLPTISSIASLFVFRHFAGRLLKGIAFVLAVAILAVGYTPIRHGGEIKPYASDFLVALALLTLAVDWIRAPTRNRFLWGLAVLGPFSVAISNPAIFVAAGCGLVLTIPVLKSRSLRSLVPLGMFGLGTVTVFVALFRSINAPQSASVMQWMRVYWANAFPPQALGPLLNWLLKVHTSHMFAYPAGGDVGASSFTTALVLVAIVAYIRRGSKTVLALLVTPFALGLSAAFLGRYPYGGSARTMQYLAPSIIVMAGLGGAVLIARLPSARSRGQVSSATMYTMLTLGLGMMAWDVAYPYREATDQASRDFARSFWSGESRDAVLICARTDLHLPLDPFVWQGNRAALYLAHQAVYREQTRKHLLLFLDRVSETHPLRIVVFCESRSDRDLMASWVVENSDRYKLISRHERVLNEGLYHGKANMEERYVVYELLPRR